MQQKLDVYANEVLLHCLGLRESIGILASEENEEPHTIHSESPRREVHRRLRSARRLVEHRRERRVGTTFSILSAPPTPATTASRSLDLLQPGSQQVAAGYVLYGSSTMLVYSAGNGVHGFTLDPAVGAYVLSHENIRMPAQGK